MNIQEDERWMQVALRMAARATGNTLENPAVGCVLVHRSQCVAQGWTQPGGRPHAETHALHFAKDYATGATAYVTLEPCAHTGRTPPCADALIRAGIARAVIGCTDPDTRVNGEGIRTLQQHGIEVNTGILQKECTAHHSGFFRRLRKAIPHISVKIATSKDEKITTGKQSPWLTNSHSRAYGHALRATHDAIVTGIGTVMHDDPMLNCRLKGREHESPIRVVLDRHAALPLRSALVQTAKQLPVWLCHNQELSDSPYIKELKQCGVTSIALPNGFDFLTAMSALAQRGINHALIEGGQRLTDAALHSGAATRFYWFKAPHEVGNGALSALHSITTLQSFTNNTTYNMNLSGDTLHITQL